SCTMSIVALSPVAPEPLSPMITSITPITPILDPDTATSSSTVSIKPPPLHTGADWKVVLHLPEIETWLRATSDRVTQLSHSVVQDGDNRHVDVHLVQLKDICEDISDHVEQIHALLETEFSLKLLSYSVNIIVDIRAVQLLWHQLRVSVLVLKERLLQGLQDSNGNYTRQTDILQAFSQDQHQTRLDALTEVDDCGQLTIRCSQDYFSLDCGITAFELSDYSPSDEPEARVTEPDHEDPPQTPTLDRAQGPDSEAASVESEGPCLSNHKLHNSLPELTTPGDATNYNSSPSVLPTMQCGTSSHKESVKRLLQGVSQSTEVSPTQPSLPKRAALLSDRGAWVEDSRGGLQKVSPLTAQQSQAELSRSTPSLMDPPDRSKFWLELDSVYPENVSQSCENLQVCLSWICNCLLFFQTEQAINKHLTRVKHKQLDATCSLQQRPVEPPDTLYMTFHSTYWSLSLYVRLLGLVFSSTFISSSTVGLQRNHVSSRQGGCSEALTNQRSPSGAGLNANAPLPLLDPLSQDEMSKQKNGTPHERNASTHREHWYGSEEFLALPAQLHKTEMLALKLESLAQSIPLEALQDVDDWDLTELNPDWDTGESGDNLSTAGEGGDDMSSLHRSPTSSSDIAPSLDESIESGLLSDLQSEEDEGRTSAEQHVVVTAPPVDGHGGACLVQKLLEDIQSQDKDKDIWKKIECFVQQLDGFISWLQEALDSTENWTQPRQELESLRAYLDTHLSFKLNVDSHSALKESIMEEGRALLTVITCHQSGTFRHTFIFIHIYTHIDQCEAQRAALEQMAIKLSSLHYPPSTSRRLSSQLARSNSLQEFEVEYQELWHWLMDMDAMVTDSHQLLMSEEQRHQLFKVRHLLKAGLLGRAESLKRSGVELPTNTPSLLGSGGGVPVQNPRSALSPLTNLLLEQLEARIKELKAWLRDTELLIFNSCLRQDKDASEQLQSFKSLCSEVRARRRGVASVLKLCQKLLQQSQHREALQLLSINLERRWEAIVMQALQWQNRLKRELGEQQVRHLHPSLHTAGSQLTHGYTQ
uniref:A kinase (PRKA) anchor protein 6 n=1 Tax=Monopterus albus TaxID=43700 RepID=A0A3Q3IVH3_MONAL